MKEKLGITKMNAEWRLRDGHGRTKRLFQPWSWVAYLIKNGHLSPHHPKLPVLFGYWSDSLKVANLVTTTGKAGVAGLINGVVTDFFDYIAVGTGTTAANVADTTLETETAASGLSRALATLTRVTTDTTNDTAQFDKSFSVTGTVAVTESGVLSASSGGTLLCRQVFSAINVVNGDTLAITWKIDVD